MKKPIVLFCVIPVILLLAGVVHAVPITWTVNGHQYEIVLSEGIGWAAANTAALAKGDGWHLATITTAEEETFIESLLTLTNSRDEFWLGGQQVPLNSAPATANWTWVNGDAWSYVKWGEGQPDDWSGGQYYLAMDSDRKSWGWDDNTATLYVIRGYIAENSAPVPEPATMLLLGSGLIGLAGFGRKALKK